VLECRYGLAGSASVCATVILLVNLAASGRQRKVNWNQFRGPHGQGAVQAETQGRFHPLNNPASSTPAADDKYVYVYVRTYGPFCCDHAGSEVWQRKILTAENKYGAATSQGNRKVVEWQCPICHCESVSRFAAGVGKKHFRRYRVPCLRLRKHALPLESNMSTQA
jgi:hypothetical protein